MDSDVSWSIASRRVGSYQSGCIFISLMQSCRDNPCERSSWKSFATFRIRAPRGIFSSFMLSLGKPCPLKHFFWYRTILATSSRRGIRSISS